MPADVAGKVTGAPVPASKFLTRLDERVARPGGTTAAADRYAGCIAGQARINLPGAFLAGRQIIGAFEDSLIIDVLNITY